jgi:hypothetical protein
MTHGNHQTKKVTSTLGFIILTIFLGHGVLYLLFPEDHYVSGSWIAYIKYIVLAPLAVASPYLLFRLPLGLWPRILVSAWTLTLASALYFGQDAMRLAVYFLPIFALFTPDFLRRALPVAALCIIGFSVGAAIVEFLYLGGFERFGDLGYRSSSIFINPNNLAMTSVILLACARPAMNRQAMVVFGLSTAALVIGSQSKTGMLMLGYLWLHQSLMANWLRGFFTSWRLHPPHLLWFNLSWFVPFG